MGWRVLGTFEADGVLNISFKGRGSIFPDGYYGGGSVLLHVVSRSDPNGAAVVSSGFLDSAVDGSTVKSIDCPSGEYQLELTGATDPVLTVYVNDQVDLSSDV